MFLEKSIENKWRYIGFNDTWFVILGIPILTLILTFLFFNEPENCNVPFIHKYIQGIPFTILYWVITRKVMQELRKTYEDLSETMKRLILVAFFVIFIAPWLGGMLNLLLIEIANFISYEYMNLHPLPIKELLSIYFACFFMVSIYEAIYFYTRLKESIEEREEAKQAQIRSQLEGLRSQVNPHFLFNSMNTLMNIVTKDQNLAINFLGKLSKVYRYVLENREEQIIPLQKELDFINAYVFLQKERFRGSLEVALNIPEAYLERKIIPLSLQSLFENAIKHNTVSQKKPLLIEVFVEGENLVVKNNLQRKEQVMDSTKFGLKNIETRYRFFTQRSISIKETNTHFSVAIPLLSSDHSIKINA